MNPAGRAAWREALIEGHLSLARATARRMLCYAQGGLDVEDLVAAGYIGLVRAADAFDPGLGVQFRSYAITRMRSAIREQARNWDIVPRSMREKERAGEADCPAPVSLDAEIDGAPVSNLIMDPAPPLEQLVSCQFLERALECELAQMPARMRYAFCAHRAGRTFPDIGRDFGVSKGRAFQIHADALDLLRRSPAQREAAGLAVAGGWLLVVGWADTRPPLREDECHKLSHL